MTRILFEKMKATGIIFKNGFNAQFEHAHTYSVAGTCGIIQGLKYSGSLKKGVVTTVVVLGGLATLNGVREVIRNRTVIKETKCVDNGRIYRIKTRLRNRAN